MRIYKINPYNLVLLLLLLPSCSDKWLDAKPNQSLVIPQTVEDYQALLDNTNSIFNVNAPSLMEVSSGDYFLTTSIWKAATTQAEKKAYVWQEDGAYDSGESVDWNSAFKAILNLNLVLEGVDKIPGPVAFNQDWWNVKASALFMRSYLFFTLSQMFCQPYFMNTDETALGLPLKLTSNINQRISRSSLKDTYSQIINDLLEAKHYLPEVPLYKSRPSKPAVDALLSRVFLSMKDYTKSLKYADSCLSQKSDLMDYNNDADISTTATYPFRAKNKETIFYYSGLTYGLSAPTRAIVDSVLYRLYSEHDRRKKLFFITSGGAIRFRGGYLGNLGLSTSLTSDEVYLNRAECLARLGEPREALNELNNLLARRIESAYFKPIEPGSDEEVLDNILIERRKELCFRGIRWTDLRRLNTDPKYQVTLMRMLDGVTYILRPNDPQYVFPVPNEEIQRSGIQQNIYTSPN